LNRQQSDPAALEEAIAWALARARDERFGESEPGMREELEAAIAVKAILPLLGPTFWRDLADRRGREIERLRKAIREHKRSSEPIPDPDGGKLEGRRITAFDQTLYEALRMSEARTDLGGKG
jgi:hypothetical protein